MSKKKKKPTKIFKPSVGKAIPLKKMPAEGLKAFRNGDYNTALALWEQVQQALPRLVSPQAMAEAYFRRALKQGPTAVTDLEKALALQPQDVRLTYHWGLMAQRNGRLEEAVAAYEKVWQKGGEFAQRAALPLALAWQQQGQDVAQTAVWPSLTAWQQHQLQHSRGLTRRPYQAAHEAGALWQGLVAYDNGRWAEAKTYLTQAAQEGQSAGISHLYLGSIAAQEENWVEAVHHWGEAHQAGFRSAQLSNNLSEAYHRLAESCLEAGEVDKALRAGMEAHRHAQDDIHLSQLIAHLQQRLAYEAANSGDWERAQTYWELAEAQAGGNFRLLCNLALAEEQAGNFLAAANRWRDALKRRPRRDDHPDAIRSEQVSRLWQRTAEAYEKAEEYEEAIDVRRLAVKWQADNFQVRLDLAQALLQNGRLRAAQNEIQQILERDPNHIPALLLMGEVLVEWENWWQASQAVHFWQRVLAIEPDHAAARQNLADYYLDRGNDYLEWDGTYEYALKNFENALEHQPDNSTILIKIGRCYLLMKQAEQGKAYLERALARQPKDLTLYAEVITSWLAAEQSEMAWEIAQQAEQTIPIPTAFYINIARACLHNQAFDLALPWLDKAVAVAKDDEAVYVQIGEMTMMVPGAEEIGRLYLQKALDTGQAPGQAQFVLGILATKGNDMNKAKKHWQEARKIARRTQDNALLERIEQAEAMFSNPLSFLLRGMMDGRFDPRMLKRLPLADMLNNLFNEEFSEDKDDDGFFD